MFITFEGLDGSGKTTQLRLLHKWLLEQGHTVTTLRQPGGTKLGEGIRELIVSNKGEAAVGRIDSYTELALMFADRAQSIAEIIRPALDRGDVVLCDRYTDSSEAYQGGGRQLGSETILGLHRLICGNLQPDLTILLLPDFDASLTRARRRDGDESRFEQEHNDFFHRVWDTYRAIATREPHRVALIEGNASIEDVHVRIRQEMASRLFT
ncbi:dTMP kinase [Terriglobus tenax]|uniref:dTMP kinase n=1 Tax=Terriglobus tenax TaxID=1111115 RepID=UPI00295BA1CD|nr:dTMP kinase [Terriglobus tenax]